MAVQPAELNQKLLEELLAVQIRAETLMLEKVAKRVKRGITTPGWNEQKLSDVQLLQKEILAVLNDTEKLSKSYIQKSILKAYESGGKNVSKALLVKPQTLMNDLIPLHLQHMILEAQNAISGTSFQILRNTMDIYREVISETTTGTLIGVETRQQVAQQTLNNFAAKGVTGFTDKIGRKWELASYVEMAVRTANARAALQGHVDRSLELGQDLMLVSNHAATCPICAPWGGKVLSITGKTLGYPTLDTAKAAGLFHPNCKHTLTVWFQDLEGNEEHRQEYYQEPDIEKYNAIQKQRYNERKIREWKRMEAVALTPEAKQKAHNKILQWQSIQRQHVEQYNLRRKYIREGIKNRTGDPTKASAKPDISKVYKPLTKITNATDGQSKPINDILKNSKVKETKDIPNTGKISDFLKQPELLSKEHKEVLDKAFKNASPEELTLIKDTLNKIPVLEYGDYPGYNVNHGAIHVQNKLLKDKPWYEATLRHEIIHAIDINPQGNWKNYFKSQTNEFEFKKSILDVRSNLKSNPSKLTQLKKELKSIKNLDDKTIVSDLFDNIFAGEVDGIRGHGKEYYSTKTGVFAGEAFANIGSLKMGDRTEALKIVEKYAPGITKKYEETIKLIANKVKKLINSNI